MTIECRWEQFFTGVMRFPASKLTRPAWVLDSNDVFWAADAVDPERVIL